MSKKKVKLVIDSVFEDLIRVITTTTKGKKTINTDIRALETILEKDKIIEGHSYLITFEDSDDYDRLLSGKIDENFEPKGKIKVKDTTKEDLKVVRELQKRLGLKA